MYQKFWKPLGLTILILLLLPISLWAAPVGKVSHIEGEADVTTPDGKIALVKAADPVSVGDILRTKAKSKVEVAFADGNTVFIAERSRLRITAYDNREDKNSTLDLFRGKTRVVVNNLAKKSAIELHTPTAVAGVRGTIWIGTFENGVSTFFFERGEGYGYNKNMPEKIVTIRAGQTMEVRGPDQPPVVRPTPIYELNRHLLDTTASRLQGQTGETPPPVPGTGEPGAPAPSRPSGQTQEETLIPSPEQYLELPPEPLPPPELPPLPPPPEPAPILPPPPPPPDTTPILEPTQPIGGDLTTPVTGLAGFSGTFDGSITGGTLSMAGTFDSGTTASTSSINGTGYDGYLAGIPGSWEGLFDAFYSPTAGSVQFLSGSLSDPNFINTAGASLNASGPLSLDPQSYTTSGGYTAFADGPMLVFEHITQFPEAIPVFGSVSGYRTSTDWIVAVGAASTTGGVYESLGPSWTRTFGGYWMREDETNSYAFLGEIEGTDDGVGHLAIRSTTPTRYMDEAYMGTINLRYRGVYTEALIGEPEPMPGYSYDSIGTAQYVLEPLVFSGFVGRNTANAFLYYRPPSDLGDAQITRDGSASMAGLIGGTNAMGSQFMAMGSYISYGIGHSIFDVDLDLYNYNTGLYSLKAYFSGYGIEDSIHGRILGLYRLPSDSGEELGWITGTTGTGTVPLGTTSMIYPEASAWETWGTLTYLPKVQASGLPDTITTESLEGSVRANTTAGVVSGSRSFFDGESWGIINAAFGGNYSADPTMPTDFQLGGTLSGGYWLADFTIASPSPSSSTFFDTPIQGRLLTETQYATFTPYSYAMGKINDPEDNAIYTGIFLAPYEGHPLLFNGSVSEGYFWRVDPADGPDKNGIINFLEGLVGGTATLYGGLLADGRYSAVPVAGMGSYKNIGDGGLFLDPLFLVRMTGQDLTLGATNAYTLLAGGVTPGYTLVGGMKGMYWRPAETGSYEFGFIIGQGEDPAELYPNLEQPMWTLGNDAQLQAYRLQLSARHPLFAHRRYGHHGMGRRRMGRDEPAGHLSGVHRKQRSHNHELGSHEPDLRRNICD
jgi:hypothetical protein